MFRDEIAPPARETLSFPVGRELLASGPELLRLALLAFGAALVCRKTLKPVPRNRLRFLPN
jgi:hypothetical protein